MSDKETIEDLSKAWMARQELEARKIEAIQKAKPCYQCSYNGTQSCVFSCGESHGLFERLSVYEVDEE